MKTKLLILFFSLIILSCNKAPQFSKINIVSYDMKVKYDTISRNLYVNSSILLEPLKQNNDKISLLFLSLAKINKICFMNKNAQFNTSYKFDKDTIFIDVPEQLQNNKKLSLYLEYKLSLDLISDKELLAVARSGKWCPLQYDNFSKWKIEIETPQNYIAYSSGDLIYSSIDNNHGYFIWENDYNLGVPLIITPKNHYSIIKKIIDNKEINFYFVNKNSIIVNKIIRELYNSFHFYNKLFGDYKHKQLSIFELDDSGTDAMSIETFIVVHDSLFLHTNDPLFGGNLWISHEIAHQWIGSGYTNTFNTKLSWFIEEGLTEYVRYMFIEDNYGKDSLNAVFKQYKNEFETQILNTNDDIPISSNSSSRVIYIKGPIIFHYVRQQIGDDNWKNFLRTLYNNYYGKVIDYEIFKSELSKYDPT
ncbi:MAG: M1 family aminopeptidase, partial [FCB group bacterium]